MRKRKIIIFLAGMLCVSINSMVLPPNSLGMTITAEAGESETIIQGDYSYKLNEDGTAVIKKYEGNEVNIVTPSQVVNGDKVYKITEIGSSAFKNKNMKSVQITGDIKSIGERAFFSCSELVSLTMPDSVETIQKDAFHYSSLKDIKLSESLRIIGEGAFECCKFTHIDIPDSVEEIGEEAFNYCSELEEFKISKGIRVIDAGIFLMCNNLKTIEVDKDSEYYQSINNIVYSKDVSRVIFASRNIEGIVKMPESVTSIENYAFKNCDKITDIEFSEKITNIGNAAFSKCNELTNIKLPENLITIGSSCFMGCGKVEKINIPDKVKEIGGDAFYDCGKLSDIKLPESVEYIGSCVFQLCNNLKSVEIENSNIKTEYDTFWYCSASNIRFKNCTNRNLEVYAAHPEDEYDKAVILGENYSEIQFFKNNTDLIFEKNLIGDINKSSVVYERQTVKYYNYRVTLNSIDCTAKIRGYEGNETEVDIPNVMQINGVKYTVTSLDYDENKYNLMMNGKVVTDYFEKHYIKSDKSYTLVKKSI